MLKTIEQVEERLNDRKCRSAWDRTPAKIGSTRKQGRYIKRGAAYTQQFIMINCFARR